jgi:hypothetical protein
MNDWQETRIWQKLQPLQGDEAEATKALLIVWMPHIQTILTQAQTSPSDFMPFAGVTTSG